jgi:transglutaminase-like putative cysteine protease
MKRGRGSSGSLFFILLMLATGLLNQFGQHSPSPPATPTEPPLQAASGENPRIHAEAGIALSDGPYLAEREVADKARRWLGTQTPGVISLKLGGHKVTPLAPAVDARLHFINAYLVGYVPDPKAPIWAPLHTLASRKIYQTDLGQYRREEVWQTSYQAMHSERGDCEDHALALADWLIGLGLDARVVLGQVKGGGHAWVVVRDGQRSFLLEATDKRRLRRWAYPLAALHPEHQPRDMFNRTEWWHHPGGPTTDYSDARWKLGATYWRD